LVSIYFREDESEHAVTARAIARHVNKLLEKRISHQLED